ncbi:MAG TPA: hypothetical protein VN238_07525, partial [Solirubrobacteraceae bacterium]|nr:hypothetical protein [Solirubrobacteraceae bacterium]
MPSPARVPLALACAAVALLAALLLPARPAAAAAAHVVEVDWHGDGADKTPGDGTCRTADGHCTLRAAIQTANESTDESFVIFAEGLAPIRPETPLPALSTGGTIDGVGEDGEPGVVLDGIALDPPADGNPGGGGFEVDGPAGIALTGSGATVVGLNIQHVPGPAVKVRGAAGATVARNWLGTTEDGMGDTGRTLDGRERSVGVLVEQSTGTVVGGSAFEEGNVVGGTQIGIMVGGNTSATKVLRNTVGMSADGTEPLGNDVFGILTTSGPRQSFPTDITIDANLIAATGQTPEAPEPDIAEGIAILRSSGVLVSRNRIGFDGSGRYVTGRDDEHLPFGTTGAAVYVEESVGVRIGGVYPGGQSGYGNQIAASDREGIRVWDAVADITIQNNTIGLDATGADDSDEDGAATGNGGDGIKIDGTGDVAPATGIKIGGTGPLEGNTIGGNDGWAIALRGAMDQPQVVGNTLGMAKNATVAAPDGEGGILTTWYGSSPEQPYAPYLHGNRIGAEPYGMRLRTGEYASVAANGIGYGVASAGSSALFPTEVGIWVDGARGTSVGGNGANRVIGSTMYGVLVTDPHSVDTAIRGNEIGFFPGAAFKPEYANRWGIAVADTTDGPWTTVPAPTGTIVGGEIEGQGNVIAGGDAGVYLKGASDQLTKVLGNTVGADAAGKLAPVKDGIVAGAPNSFIGAAKFGNAVVGATHAGVRVLAGAYGTEVAGNVLGLARDGYGNRHGVLIEGSGAFVGAGRSWSEPLPKDCRADTGCNEITGSARAAITVAGGTGSVLRGNRFRENPLNIDLLDADADEEPHANALDRKDADTGPNGLVNRPTVVQRVGDAVTGQVESAAPAELQIDVFAAGEHGDDPQWIGATKPDARGRFRFPLPAGTSGHEFLATATDPDGFSEYGDTSEFSDSCVDGDSDADGICDDWEEQGLDFDGDGASDLDLAARGAKVGVGDAFLEVDAMEPEGLRQPYPETALPAVVRAFDRNGVRPLALHIAGGDRIERVPPVDAPLPVSTRTAGTGFNDLADYRYGPDDDVCASRFGTAADRVGARCFARLGALGTVSRYLLSALQLERGGSGASQPGMALDAATMAEGVEVLSPSGVRELTKGARSCGNTESCRATLRSYVMLRQLGLTMGLAAEGSLARLSVMNPTYAWPRSATPLGFSHGDGPSVDERAISDTVGLPMPAAPGARGWLPVVTALRTVRVGEDVEEACVWAKVPAGRFDFDQDGEDDAGPHGVNDPGGDACVDSDNATEKGADDVNEWQKLTLPMSLVTLAEPTAGLGADAGAARMAAAAPEATVEGAGRFAWSDLDGDGVLDRDDVCPLVKDAAQADADGDGWGDACLEQLVGSDLSVAVEAPEALRVGEQVEAKVTLGEDWPRAAGAATVKLTAPAGTAFVSGSGDGTFAPSTGVWSLDGVAARGQATLTVVLRGTAKGGGELRA